jgi:hypothetical protein
LRIDRRGEEELELRVRVCWSWGVGVRCLKKEKGMN